MYNVLRGPSFLPQTHTFCFLKSYFDSFQRKLKIEDETEFCTEDLLHTLLRCKVSYDIFYSLFYLALKIT